MEEPTIGALTRVPRPVRTDRVPGRAQRPAGAPHRRAHDAVLGLQRTAGNRATAALLAGSAGTGPAVQRQAPLAPALDALDPAEKDAEFDAAGGNTLVSTIRAALPGWQLYRAAPRSGDQGTVSALTTVENALAAYGDTWRQPWMQAHARTKLGHEYLAYLGEMRSLFPAQTARLSDLFGVSYRPVQHNYQLRMAGSTSLLDSAVGSILPRVSMTYTNSLGWGWQTELYLVGAQLGVSVGWEAGFGAEERSAEDRADAILREPRPWWWPIGSPFSRPQLPRFGFQPPTKLPKAGASRGFGPISIALQGTATASSSHLWGPDDVTGLCRYVEAPGLVADSPLVNATAHLGGLLEFVTGWDPAPLGFILEADADISAKPKPKAKIKIGANLLSMAIGWAVAAGDPSFDQPAVAPPALLDADRHWQLSVGPFATGGADARPFLDDVDQFLAAVLAQLNASEQHDALAAAGVDPQQNYTLDVEVVGLASRRWAGAGSEEDRLLNNTALAMARADAVADLLRERAGGTPLRITTTAGQDGQAGGPGAAVFVETGPDTGHFVILSDAEAEERLRERRTELDARLARGEISEEEHRVEVMLATHELSAKSDPAQARRAMIIVSWRGKQVQIGETAAP